MLTSISNYLSGAFFYSSQNSGNIQEPISYEPSEKSGVEKVQEEMNRRNNLGYGLGVALGRLLGTRNDDFEATEKKPKKVTKISTPKISGDAPEPLSNYYSKIFPQKNLEVIYIGLDPGVDDGAALLQLLASVSQIKDPNINKNVLVKGLVPCVGNAVISQTEQNALQYLELTKNQGINVYPGAIAPLAIESDPAAIEKMNQGINATHFYGHDGEADVGGWPMVSMKMQSIPGYKFAASMISNASQESALTLITTASLTELSKTLTELMKMDALKGVPEGSFAKNINAISIMGGCVDPKVGCNAPFNVPDSKKNSEANFYFDSPAAMNVFSICQKFGIPILLSPLDLTQQPGLLWTKEQVSMLKNINNSVAQQMARVTNVVPYLDAPCFPNNTFPMHDLFATASILRPDFFSVTRMAISIGDVGQIIPNLLAPEEVKNVYVISMPIEKQVSFYKTVLKEYENFNCLSSEQSDNCKNEPNVGMTGLIIALTVSGIFATLTCVGLSRRKSNTDSNPPTEDTPLV
jgi:inosine-uridine nucleoside N-ribohydrolase